jgi:hypothetical protein
LADAEEPLVAFQFVADPAGDPFLLSHTLLVAPAQAHALRSGKRYIAVVRRRLAEAGVAVVSRDQPLYGTRYPLIDEGHGPSTKVTDVRRQLSVV